MGFAMFLSMFWGFLLSTNLTNLFVLIFRSFMNNLSECNLYLDFSNTDCGLYL
jgi:hypothetical protein